MLLRLCWQMINTKLLKGNRLLDMTPEGARPATFLKRRLWPRCFPANFVKFSRTPFSQSTSGRLLLWLIKYEILIVRRSHQRCSVEKGVLKNFIKFTGKHLCQNPFFNKVSGVSVLAKVFSCEVYKIFKTTFFQNTSGGLLPYSDFSPKFFLSTHICICNN